MTWIKPSFFWMAYRSGWSEKPNQTVSLCLWIETTAFLALLEQSVISHFDPDLHPSHEEWLTAQANSSVRVQWDPERDAWLNRRPAERAIQVGVSGAALPVYLDAICEIEDVSRVFCRLKNASDEIRSQAYQHILKVEIPIPLTEQALKRTGAQEAI